MAAARKFSARRVMQTIKQICSVSQCYPPSLDQFNLHGQELAGYLENSGYRLGVYDTAMQNIGLRVQWRMFGYEDKAAVNSLAWYGNWIPDNCLIFLTHHDHCAGLGAEDNATSTAVMIELARVVGAYKVCFLSCDLQEPGNKGSGHFVSRLSEDERRKIKAVVDLECLGSGKDLIISTQVGEALSDPGMVAQLREISKRQGHEFALTSYPCFFANHIPFAKAGFKTVQITSGDLDHVVDAENLEQEMAFLRSGGVHEGGSVLHSKNDLPEYLKKQNLQKIGDVLVEFVRTHFSA